MPNGSVQELCERITKQPKQKGSPVVSYNDIADYIHCLQIGLFIRLNHFCSGYHLGKYFLKRYI